MATKKSTAQAAAKRGPAPAAAKAPSGPAKRASKGAAARSAGARSSGEGPLDKFSTEQKSALEAERETYAAQAVSLKAEADQMAQEAEPGDVQFDEESGEGAR